MSETLDHTDEVSRGVTPQGFHHRWRLIFHIECSHELWNETEPAPKEGSEWSEKKRNAAIKKKRQKTIQKSEKKSKKNQKNQKTKQKKSKFNQRKKEKKNI